MELKWIEDLIVLSRTGHFARAADIRLITQSALSRRIQSLEQWAGTELVDRSRHPITLTPAGQDFIGPAKAIANQAYEAQAAASNSMFVSHSEVRINTLHSLSMRRVPNLVYLLRQRLGEFDVSVDTSARALQDDLYSLKTGNCDFFISIEHPDLAISIDPEIFPFVEIAGERMQAYSRDPSLFERFSADCMEPIPLVALFRSATSSRALRVTLANAPFASRLRTVYRASLAESLRKAVQLGMGIAWLPASIVTDESGGEKLTPYTEGFFHDFKILVYRSVNNERPIVNRIWNELCDNSHDGQYAGLLDM